MKNKFYLLLFVTACSVSMFSCEQNSEDLCLASGTQHCEVYVTYKKNKASVSYDSCFDLTEVPFYDSESNVSNASDLVPGDKLDIKYSDGTVYRVDIHKAQLIEVAILFPPGGGRPSIIYDGEGVFIVDGAVEYVIDKDGTYTNLKDRNPNDVFYGVYNPNDNETDHFVPSTITIVLKAIYSYKPF